MLTPAEHDRFSRQVHGADVTRVAATFEALSEPNRCLIFRALLKGRDISVGQLASIVGISEPLASQHLKILREADLVTRQKHGKYVYYRVATNNSLVSALSQAVEG